MKIKLRPNKKLSSLFILDYADSIAPNLTVSEQESIEFLQSLTIKELLRLIEVGISVEPRERPLDLIYRYKRSRQALEQFTNFLEATNYHDPSIPKAPLEQTLEEAILLTMKEFYGITSLEEVIQRSVAEFLIARKDIYNRLYIQDKITKHNK